MQTAEIDWGKFAEFLVDSKIRAYAGGRKYTKTDDGFLTFEHEEDGLLFQDKYQEGKDKGQFFGFERSCTMPYSRPIHVMQYSGGITKVGRKLIESGHTTEEGIWNFLKQALLRITPQDPFRGPVIPDGFTDEKLVYMCRLRPDLPEDNFLNRQGEEQIAILGIKELTLRSSYETIVHHLYFTSRVLI